MNKDWKGIFKAFSSVLKNVTRWENMKDKTRSLYFQATWIVENWLPGDKEVIFSCNYSLRMSHSVVLRWYVLGYLRYKIIAISSVVWPSNYFLLRWNWGTLIGNNKPKKHSVFQIFLCLSILNFQAEMERKEKEAMIDRAGIYRPSKSDLRHL